MFITFIWLIFAIYFAVLMVCHFKQANINYPKFDPSVNIKTVDCSFVNATAMENEAKLDKFFNEFNNLTFNIEV